MGRLGQKIKKYGALGVKTAVGLGAMVGAGYLGAKTGDGGVSTSQESGTPMLNLNFFKISRQNKEEAIHSLNKILKTTHFLIRYI